MPWFVQEIVDSVKKIPSVVQDLMDNTVVYTRPAPAIIETTMAEEPAPAPTPAPIIKESGRGIDLSREEVDKFLRPMLYSEISTIYDRPEDKVDLEARVVTNTVLNRMKNRKMSLSEVITEPDQYQGIDHPKFKSFGTETDELNKKQVAHVNKIVDQMLSEIESGQFEDNVTGAEFYGHMKDGTIKAFDTWPEYKKAIDAGLIK